MFGRRVFMCRPDHFAVSYKINPWMEPDRPDQAVQGSLASRQWQELHHAIIRLGGFVEYVDPCPDLPDMCFTANAGIFHAGKVVASRFRHPERSGEEGPFREAFRRLGYEVHEASRYFEGAGDAFVMNDTLLLGTGFRSDSDVAYEILDLLGLRRLVVCRLIDPYFYHLDTCFCPIDHSRAIFFPGAFHPETLDHLASLKGIALSPVDEAEARKFACNAVILREPRVHPAGEFQPHAILPTGCPKTRSMLGKMIFNTPGMLTCMHTHEVDVSQFLKAGGACKCLTLLLD